MASGKRVDGIQINFIYNSFISLFVDPKNICL